MTYWSTPPYQWNPEYGPRPSVEQAAEMFGDNPERIDTLNRIEWLTAKIIESGPELDEDAYSALYDELVSLLATLGIDSTQPWEDIYDELKAARTELDDYVGDTVDAVIEKLDLDEDTISLLRPAIEKIVTLRKEWASDRAAYRALARTYHPDVTVLPPEEAQEVFKLIGQLLYDQESSRFRRDLFG